MGEIRTSVTLIGPGGQVTVGALVDTGATLAAAPRSTLEQLGIQPMRAERFSLADGRIVEREVGAVTARIDGKEAPTLCVFADEGTEPLLGVVVLESLMLAVDPVNQTLVPVTGRLKLRR